MASISDNERQFQIMLARNILDYQCAAIQLAIKVMTDLTDKIEEEATVILGEENGKRQTKANTLGKRKTA